MDRLGEDLDTGVAGAAGRGLRPATALTISEWAETYRVWAGRSVAEAGRYRIARTPYIRELLDCLSEGSPVQRLVVMKAARLGFSEGVVMNCIGYHLHHSPAPCLLVLPTLTMAQRVARESLEPMLQATPELRLRLGTTRGRGELRSTLLMKEVPNGSIALVGANSAAALRQTAAKIVLVDELDACPRDVEGDGSPLAIAEARARTFGPSRKVVLVSSPTEKGRSLIEAEFVQTDQRRYEVPCPFCGARQELTIDGLTWETDQPETARYLCGQCRTPIDEGRKAAMIAAGTWRATARSDPRRRGYHLSSLYSPSEWFSWADVARAAISAERDPMAMKPYMNTVLGQCYAERMEQVDWQVLAARQTPLLCGVVPPGVFMLTAGIDVQDSELQCHIWGWGAYKRRWLVDVRHLPGSTRREDAPWDALATLLGQTWPTVDGRHQLGLRMSAIDAGHQADRVYGFARRIGLARLLVVKGKSSCPRILGVPWRAESLDTTGKRTAARRRRGLVLYPVGTDVAKHEFYAALRGTAVPGAPLPAGYVSLPQVGEAVCKELCSEALVRKRVAGREVESWQRVTRPNDGLDGAETCGPTAVVQRCQVHKRRNVLEHLPEAMRPRVCRALAEAYELADAALAKRRLLQLAAGLDHTHPGAAASLREGLDETLTLQRLGVTGALYRTLRSTNGIENLNGLIGHFVRHVRRWRDGRMLVRWIAAGLQEVTRSFRRLRGHRDLAALIRALDRTAMDSRKEVA